jgi:hypothetical protein
MEWEQALYMGLLSPNPHLQSDKFTTGLESIGSNGQTSTLNKTRTIIYNRQLAISIWIVKIYKFSRYEFKPFYLEL